MEADFSVARGDIADQRAVVAVCYAESNRIRSGHIADENIVTTFVDEETHPVVPGDILDEAAVLALQEVKAYSAAERIVADEAATAAPYLDAFVIAAKGQIHERVPPIGQGDAIPAVGNAAIANVGVASFDPDTCIANALQIVGSPAAGNRVTVEIEIHRSDDAQDRVRLAGADNVRIKIDVSSRADSGPACDGARGQRCRQDGKRNDACRD